MKEFDVEYQYQEYLRKCNLSEDKMHPEQKKQVKDSFYAGMGQILLIFGDEVRETGKFNFMQNCQKMLKQIALHFAKYIPEKNKESDPNMN